MKRDHPPAVFGLIIAAPRPTLQGAVLVAIGLSSVFLIVLAGFTFAVGIAQRF